MEQKQENFSNILALGRSLTLSRRTVTENRKQQITTDVDGAVNRKNRVKEHRPNREKAYKNVAQFEVFLYQNGKLSMRPQYARNSNFLLETKIRR